MTGGSKYRRISVWPQSDGLKQIDSKEAEKMHQKIRRLFLSVGEEVTHLGHPEWGIGKVVEEKNSNVAGGMSLVKIEFRNAGDKTFDNNIESLYCCYHAGIRRLS